MIQFHDDDHKSRYEDLMQRMAAEDWDTNRAAFAYLVAIMRHITGRRSRSDFRSIRNKNSAADVQ